MISAVALMPLCWCSIVAKKPRAQSYPISIADIAMSTGYRNLCSFILGLHCSCIGSGKLDRVGPGLANQDFPVCLVSVMKSPVTFGKPLPLDSSCNMGIILLALQSCKDPDNVQYVKHFELRKYYTNVKYILLLLLQWFPT